jgi:hypothetical protein
MNNPMLKTILPLMAFSNMCGNLFAPGRKIELERKFKKCSLPSCNIETDHNGGYCCAEHCKEHHAKLRSPDPVGVATNNKSLNTDEPWAMPVNTNPAKY